MIYISLISTCLDSVGYDPRTGRMDVTFVSGKTFTLTGVPDFHFHGLVNATFHGAYRNEHLKGNY